MLPSVFHVPNSNCCITCYQIFPDQQTNSLDYGFQDALAVGLKDHPLADDEVTVCPSTAYLWRDPSKRQKPSCSMNQKM
jgi:hypothetical protein